MIQETAIRGLRVFVPTQGMQGDDVPIYVLWNPISIVRIDVLIPDGISIKETYNATLSKASKAGSLLSFDKFESNGYLGLVLGTTRYELAREMKEISVIVKSGTITKVHAQTLCLFRPEIEVAKNPSNIRVEMKDGRIRVLDKIGLTNTGSGTAIIGFGVQKGSRLTLSDSSGLEAFISSFWSDIETRMIQVKKKYNAYEEAIDGFLSLAKGIFKVSKKDRNRTKAILDELDNALDEDEKFREVFVSSILSAFFKYLSIITPMEAFVAFLSSIASSRILFLNPLQVLHVTNEERKVRAVLEYTDLAGNEYDKLKVEPFVICANTECEVPVYQLFEVIPHKPIIQEACLEPRP